MIQILDEILTVDAALPAAQLALEAAHQAKGDAKAARTVLRGLETPPGCTYSSFDPSSAASGSVSRCPRASETQCPTQ